VGVKAKMVWTVFEDIRITSDDKRRVRVIQEDEFQMEKQRRVLARQPGVGDETKSCITAQKALNEKET